MGVFEKIMSSPQQINPYFIKQLPGHKSVIDKICEGVTSPEELVKEVHGRIINRHGMETIIASHTGIVT